MDAINPTHYKQGIVTDMNGDINKEMQDKITPSYYTSSKIECIDAIESATIKKKGLIAVCTANVIKYLWRCEDKNGLEDLYKAKWYLDKLIAEKEKQTKKNATL